MSITPVDHGFGSARDAGRGLDRAGLDAFAAARAGIEHLVDATIQRLIEEIAHGGNPAPIRPMADPGTLRGRKRLANKLVRQKS